MLGMGRWGGAGRVLSKVLPAEPLPPSSPSPSPPLVARPGTQLQTRFLAYLQILSAFHLPHLTNLATSLLSCLHYLLSTQSSTSLSLIQDFTSAAGIPTILSLLSPSLSPPLSPLPLSCLQILILILPQSSRSVKEKLCSLNILSSLPPLLSSSPPPPPALVTAVGEVLVDLYAANPVNAVSISNCVSSLLSSPLAPPRHCAVQVLTALLRSGVMAGPTAE